MNFLLPLAIWTVYVSAVFVMYPRKIVFSLLVSVPTAVAAVLGVYLAIGASDEELLFGPGRLLMGMFAIGAVVCGVFFDLKKAEKSAADFIYKQSLTR